MDNWSEGYVDAGGLRTHYWRTGGSHEMQGAASGRLPLVLVHGFQNDGTCWAPVARALEGKFDVLMPDARGHGLSDTPPNDYSREAMAGDLAAFCAALGLDHPLLLGHSMGANTVMTAVAHDPDLARTAILVDPPWRESAPNAPGPDAGGAAAVIQFRAQWQMTHEQKLAWLNQIRPLWDEEDRQLWARACGRMRKEALRVLTEARPAPVVLPMEQHGWRTDLRRIVCPILLVTAKVERGAIVTPDMAVEAQALNPRLQVVCIAGAGHDIQRDQRAAFVRAVLDFIGTL